VAGTLATVITAIGLALVAFVVMEPVTWAAHRFVMHGPGWVLHRSHHAARTRAFELNDLYPVAFAAVVGAGLLVGFNVPGWGWLVPVGVGVTAYGAAYALVHDGYIHRRLPVGTRRFAALDALARAHAVHHRTGGEPFGMLAPHVPDTQRRRRTTDGHARTAT
jgi:beta-carotene 3-hydroxylase